MSDRSWHKIDAIKTEPCQTCAHLEHCRQHHHACEVFVSYAAPRDFDTRNRVLSQEPTRRLYDKLFPGDR